MTKKVELYECPTCHKEIPVEEFDGGTCVSCSEKGFWIDLAGGVHFDDPDSDEFIDPAAMYE
jgi:hypothetical protein